jgi:hypothetical protein
MYYTMTPDGRIKDIIESLARSTHATGELRDIVKFIDDLTMHNLMDTAAGACSNKAGTVHYNLGYNTALIELSKFIKRCSAGIIK